MIARTLIALMPTPTVDAAGPGVEGPSVEDVFNLLDENGDGFITEDELRGAAEKGGIALTDEQVAAFMAADADGDGRVSLAEFVSSLGTSILGGDFLIITPIVPPVWIPPAWYPGAVSPSW